MPHADAHDRQEHPDINIDINILPCPGGDPGSLNLVDWRDNYHAIDLTFDDPTNTSTILDVLRALHGRKPDLYEQVIDDYHADAADKALDAGYAALRALRAHGSDTADDGD